MPRLRIRELAEAQGLTAARLSRRADLAYGTVKAIWDGKRDDVALHTLTAIAGALGVSVRDLIENGGNKAEAGND